MDEPACGEQHGDAIEEALEIVGGRQRGVGVLNGFADRDDAGVAGRMAMVANAVGAVQLALASHVCSSRDRRRSGSVRLGMIGYRLRGRPLRKRVHVAVVVPRNMVVTVIGRRHRRLRL